MKYIFVLSLLIIISFSQGQTDEEICEEYEPNNQCHNAILSSPDKLCCLKKSNVDGENSKCSILDSGIYEILSNPILKSLYREINGFDIYKSDSASYYDYLFAEYECRDGTVNFNQFTEEEINILKSENYCLYYFNQGLIEDKSVSPETCFNADLFPSTKSYNIECGYYSFDIIYKDGSKKNIKTCYFLNKEKSTTVDDYIDNKLESTIHNYYMLVYDTYDIKYFYGSEYLCEDIRPETENDCTSYLVKTTNQKCCYISTIVDYNDITQNCALFSNEEYTMYTDSKYLNYYKEYYGFLLRDENGIPSVNIELKVNCIDKQKSSVINYNQLNEQDKEDFNNENHCLSYVFNIFNGDIQDTSEETCYKAIVSQSAKKEGLECGYLNIKLNYEDKTQKTIKTCYLFYPDLYKTDKLDIMTQSRIYDIVQKFKYNDDKYSLSSYTIQTGNLEGISATYDSINQKVTLNNGEKNGNNGENNGNNGENNVNDDDLFKEKKKSSKGYIINISKKIFLFLSLL